MSEIDLSLHYSCPVCGAAPLEQCELNSGTPRFESHIDRREIAKDHHPNLSVAMPLPASRAPQQRRTSANYAHGASRMI
jgi:hypothetical protein